MSDQEDVKAVFKQALKEWLDEKFMTFGKWSAVGISCMILGVMAYLALHFAGWSPPHP